MDKNSSTEAGSFMGSADAQEALGLITAARAKGRLATLGAYTKLSGPGWLQSAITLGGGSLAASLYLGVIGGYDILWLQPLAMLLGIVMLSAIGYFALSTEMRPFSAINRHVSPVLGWGWAIATLISNLVFAMPQFSLATATLRQNIMPGILGPDAMPENTGKTIACLVLAASSIIMVIFYNGGSKGYKIFDTLLKLMVGAIVLCFFGVVIKMSFSKEGLDWGSILRGAFIPNLKLLSSPAKAFAPFVAAVDSRFQQFWTKVIIGQQRDLLITGVATAVGINMTFLMPYSLLKRGWNKHFRGLMVFDLLTGLFIPFVLAINCVVIASAAQFHARPAAGFLGETNQAGQAIQPAKNLLGSYKRLTSERVKYEIGGDAFGKLTAEEKTKLAEALPAADKKLCAMLVQRDAYNLAQSLAPLTGDVVAHYVFGIGVIGMAVSTIIILMLINGFVFCEMLDVPSKGWKYWVGGMAPCIGALGPFVWTGGKAQFYIAVPAFMFGMVLLPIAYGTFFLLMNNKAMLGDNIPKGYKRVWWNVLMLLATGFAGFGCIWSIWSSRMRWMGIGIIAGFIALVLIVHIARRKSHSCESARQG